MVVPTFEKYPRRCIVKAMLHHADDVPSALITPTDASAFERFWEHKRPLYCKLSVSRFKRSHTLGVGGGGAVVRARLRQSTVVYAVKGVPFQGTDKEYEPRESNIARYITTCRVPFTAILLGSFVDAGLECLITEEALYGDILSVLREERGATVKDTFRWAVELTAALTALHGHGIIHRDVKPSNILIDAERHVRLTDWGMAYWAKRDDASYWETHKRIPSLYAGLGTKGYLSPEMLQSKRYGASVDWWALGVVMYQIMAMKHPFVDKEGQVHTRYILQRQIEMPRAAVEKYGDAAVNFVRSLLVRDPKRRIGDATVKQAAYFFGVDWELLNGPFCNSDAVLKFAYTLLPDRPEPADGTGVREPARYFHFMSLSGSSVATTASHASTSWTSACSSCDFSYVSSVAQFDDAIDYSVDDSLVMPMPAMEAGGGEAEADVSDVDSELSLAPSTKSEEWPLFAWLPPAQERPRHRAPGLFRVFAKMFGF